MANNQKPEEEAAQKAGRGAARMAKKGGRKVFRKVWKRILSNPAVLALLGKASLLIGAAVATALVVVIIGAVVTSIFGDEEEQRADALSLSQSQLDQTPEFLADSPEAFWRDDVYGVASRTNQTMPWQILAAISQTQTRQGDILRDELGPVAADTFVDYTANNDGGLTPGFVGFPMNGQAPMEFAPIANVTLPDQSVVPDYVVGPLQIRYSYFLKYKSRFSSSGSMNGVGKADPQNIYDQVATIARQIGTTTFPVDPSGANNKGVPGIPKVDIRTGLQKFFNEAVVLAPDKCAPTFENPTPCGVEAEESNECPTGFGSTSGDSITSDPNSHETDPANCVEPFPTTYMEWYYQVLRTAERYGLDNAVALYGIEFGLAGTDIPPLLRDAYLSAAELCPGMPPALLAAIGSVASNHASGGEFNTTSGTLNNPTFGEPTTDPTLPLIDQAMIDKYYTRHPDPQSLLGTPQRPIGNMGLTPSSWESYAVRSNMSAGLAGSLPDIYNAYDQVSTAAHKVCNDFKGQFTIGAMTIESVTSIIAQIYTDPTIAAQVTAKYVEYTPNPTNPNSIGVPDGSSNPADMVTVGGMIINGRAVGRITIHKSIAPNVTRLLIDAANAGHYFGGGGYRDSANQIRLRKAHCGSSDYAVYQMPASQCSPPTARPGQSMHERGLAIDFSTPTGGTFSTAAFNWLSVHAGAYGLCNLPSERWHWSVNCR